MHSVWWARPYEKGSDLVRFTVGALWILHTIFLHGEETPSRFVPLIIAAAMIGFVVVFWWLTNRTTYLLATCSGVVLLVQPVNALIGLLNASPEGLTPLLSSFLLLGIGTAFAVQRKRRESRNVAPSNGH